MGFVVCGCGELMTSVRSLVYDVTWQELRVGTLSENRSDGGWTTIDGAHANLKSLRIYLSTLRTETFSEFRMQLTPNEVMAARHYRVINMLNATRMGYSGQKLQGSEQDELVRKFRNRVQNAVQVILSDYDAALVSAASKWDWESVELELKWLLNHNPNCFDRIKVSVNKRAGVATKRGRVINQTRKELVTFCDLIRKVEG